ncbi:MAG: signal peptidase I [Actinomycetota bacterium]|nr:signal peptidase I [Actinomycetota bacterium]
MRAALRTFLFLLRTAGRLSALAMLGLAILVVSGHLRLQPVLTGSMTPRFPVGTLVAVSPVRVSTLRVGDVVMFVPPRPYGTPTGGPIMHRLVSIKTGPDGHLQLRTKGDANQAQDPWVLDGNAGGFARLRASSVAAGRALALVRHSTSGPALLIWPGVLLLWIAARRAGKDGEAPSDANAPRPARYQPRHAAGHRVVAAG